VEMRGGVQISLRVRLFVVFSSLVPLFGLLFLHVQVGWERWGGGGANVGLREFEVISFYFLFSFKRR
jgi:hypothetical protein